MTIGQEIRDRRERRKITRDDLVELLALEGISVHRNTVANWEGGEREPRYSELIALKKVLGIRLIPKEDRDDDGKQDGPHE